MHFNLYFLYSHLFLHLCGVDVPGQFPSTMQILHRSPDSRFSLNSSLMLSTHFRLVFLSFSVHIHHHHSVTLLSIGSLQCIDYYSCFVIICTYHFNLIFCTCLDIALTFITPVSTICSILIPLGFMTPHINHNTVIT